MRDERKQGEEGRRKGEMEPRDAQREKEMMNKRKGNSRGDWRETGGERETRGRNQDIKEDINYMDKESKTRNGDEMAK